MNSGAVIIAAGCGDAPMLQAGGISVAQRMIAVFQKAGVRIITVVTGPQDRKLEKHLSRSGVLFLQSKYPEDRDLSVRLGLDYMRDKCQRVFLMDADRPLLSPDTLLKLLSSRAELAIPSFQGRPGVPMLMSAGAAESVCASAKVENVLSKLECQLLPVQDEGILLSAASCQGMTEAFANHDRTLDRLVLELSVSRGKSLIDSKLINLLYFVDETQSVRDACGRMQISYSTAWNMLNTAEKDLGYPLVDRNKGGASGTGSVLTDRGHKLLNTYFQMYERLKDTADMLYDEFCEKIM